MKSFFRGYTHSTFFVLLSISLLLISCDKKDETTTGPDSGSPGSGSNSGSTYFTFKVNGVAQNFSQYNTVGYYYSASNGTYITTSPSGFSYPSVNLGFPGKTTGTFTQTSGGWLDYTDANNVDYYYEPSTCSITVTQYGDVGGYIVGTFSAVKHSSSSTATITEGIFSVRRTY